MFLRSLVFVLFVLGIYFALAPFVIESIQNETELEMIFIPDETKKFHQSLFIADMHADSLLWKRNLLEESSRGHVDIPRLQAGNVALQFFTIVTKSPRNLNIHSNTASSDTITLLSVSQLWPMQTWTSLYERARYQAQMLETYQYDSNGVFIVIKNRSDLVEFLEERKDNPKLVGGLLGLEGAHAIEKDLEHHMQGLYDVGLRMMAPTHFFDNAIGGSAHGTGRDGLTEKGKEFIKEANRLGIIIDLAHASEPTIRDALQLSTRPMVVSHTGLKGHCNNNRNLADDLAKEIVRRGGLIAIGFWSTAVCATSVDAIADAIVYAIRTLGENNVALGSDFDGAVKTPLDASKMVWLTQSLISKGLEKSKIQKVMGQNQLDFLLRNLPTE